MSAFIRIVPEADYEVLQRYVDDHGSILIRESVAQKLFPEKMDELESLDLIEYDFGGEADVYLDIISSERHCAVGPIRQALQANFKDDETED